MKPADPTSRATVAPLVGLRLSDAIRRHRFCAAVDQGQQGPFLARTDPKPRRAAPQPGFLARVAIHTGENLLNNQLSSIQRSS